MLGLIGLDCSHVRIFLPRFRGREVNFCPNKCTSNRQISTDFHLNSLLVGCSHSMVVRVYSAHPISNWTLIENNLVSILKLSMF
jgi:hypothetical protein